MLRGLYGDLPPPSSAEEDVGGGSSTWSGSSAKMAPPTLRKPSLFAAPPSVLRNQSASKPKAASSTVIGAIPSKVGRWVLEGNASPLVSAADMDIDCRPALPPTQPALFGASATVIEEYDPARPNDYDEYFRERKRRKMEEEMRREVERRRIEEEERAREQERELQWQRALETEGELEREKESGTDRGAALHISGEEAWKRSRLHSGG